MKNIFLTILVSIIVMNCSLGDDNQKADIIGKWKLIETYDDLGDGGGDWVIVSVDDSYTYQFKDDNTFIRSGGQSDCNGVYSLESNVEQYSILTLTCQNSEGAKRTQSFNNNYLIIDVAPYGCDESCAEKFKRID